LCYNTAIYRFSYSNIYIHIYLCILHTKGRCHNELLVLVLDTSYSTLLDIVSKDILSIILYNSWQTQFHTGIKYQEIIPTLVKP